MPTSPDPVRVSQLVEWYETLSPETLPRVAEFYSPQALFRDPFNDVQGVPAIAAIFSHMFQQVEAPRFKVTGVFDGGASLMLSWDFTFSAARKPCCVQGVSRLQFAPDGLIVEHVDYWDTASELFVHLPLIGPLFKCLLRRFAAPQGARQSVRKR